MPWVPGQSGFPKGGGNRRIDQVELRAHARPHAFKAIDRMAEIIGMEHGGDPRLVAEILRACIALVDRAGLVPPAPEKLDGEEAPPTSQQTYTTSKLMAAAKGDA